MRAVIRWSHDLLDERDQEAFRRTVGVRRVLRPRGGQRSCGRRRVGRSRPPAQALAAHPGCRPGRTGSLPLPRPGATLRPRGGDTDDARQVTSATPWVPRAVSRHESTAGSRRRRRRRGLQSLAPAPKICEGPPRPLSPRLGVRGSPRADMYWPWFLDGQLSELRSWASAVLSAETDAHVRARLLRILASTALAQGDAAIAVDYARRQLDAATALQDLELVAWPRTCSGWPPGHGATTPPLVNTTSLRWVTHATVAARGRLPSSRHWQADRTRDRRPRGRRGLLREAEALAEEIGDGVGKRPGLPSACGVRIGSHHRGGRLGVAEPRGVPEHRLSGGPQPRPARWRLNSLSWPAITNEQRRC